MRSFSVKARLLALLPLVLAVSARAAEPTLPETLSYQGVLVDTGGVPRTGNVSLTLRIFDQLTGGTLVYTQSFAAVPLADGVFTVELGPSGQATDAPTNPLTTSLSLALTGDAGVTAPQRFLEVTVGAQGPLARTQILTVPYALRSGRADTADTASTATVATTVTTVGGLPAEVLTQIFDNTNFDNSGPGNSDPREGTSDTDGDGRANFVDSDNDNDGIEDGSEIQQGSDMNLVTPVISALQPPSGTALGPTIVTVQGSNFLPGLSVQFGAQNPTPSNLTPTSFDVTLQPTTPGGVLPLVVTLPNGETDSAEYENLLSKLHGVSILSGTQLSFDSNGSRFVIGGDQQYGIDADIGQIFAFPGEGQIAVALDGAGRIAGLRCRTTSGSECTVEVSVDLDGDGSLTDETGTPIEVISGSPRALDSPSLTFDTSGRPVASYIRLSGSALTVVVAHDRDGNGLFTGTNERVDVDTPSIPETDLGQVAVDASGSVATVYRYAGGEVRVAYDRSGDGDFDDVVGGQPEIQSISNAAAPTAICLGIGFDTSQRLAVLWGTFSSSTGVRLLRDLDSDGSLFGGGETLQVVTGGFAPTSCALAIDGGGLSVAYSQVSSATRLARDRNGDGDFADTDENVVVTGTTSTPVGVSNATGATVVTPTRAYADPVL